MALPTIIWIDHSFIHLMAQKENTQFNIILSMILRYEDL